MQFTGGNLAPPAVAVIRSGDLQDSAEAFNRLRPKVLALARFLANGPWDVDNDLDGLPDSVWCDFALPQYTTSDNTRVKPMIAALIEDLDGKVNFNQAGNLRQLITTRFASSNPAVPTNTNTRAVGDKATFPGGTSATQGLISQFGRGGGLGPAEIDFTHMLSRSFAIPAGENGPNFHSQLSGGLSPSGANSPMRTTVGQLLSGRYGGGFISYAAPTVPVGAIFQPGNGTLNLGPAIAGANQTSSNTVDPLSEIPYPGRADYRTDDAPMGLAVDVFGVSQTRPDRNGNPMMDAVNKLSYSSPSSAVNLSELINQPYESGLGDDVPFDVNSPAEYLRLIDEILPETADKIDDILEDEFKNNIVLRRLANPRESASGRARGARSIEFRDFGAAEVGSRWSIGRRIAIGSRSNVGS